jgi:hypothetical protein
VPYVPVTTRAALLDQLADGGPALVHVRTERDANVALHRRVWDAVAAVLPPG